MQTVQVPQTADEIGAPSLEQHAAVVVALQELAGRVTALEQAAAPAPVPPAPPAPAPEPPPSTFLRELSADPISAVQKPSLGQAYVDPAYGATVRRVTDAQAQYGTQYARHFYSRKQAFSHDGTKLMIWATDGYWHIHDTSTGQKLISPVPGLAGDCEAQWHPVLTDTIVFTSQNGGLVWYALDLTTMQQRVLFDLRGRLPWSNAARAWSKKGEGSLSADGKKVALLLETDQFSQLGVAFMDIERDQFTAVSVAQIGGGVDHVSVTPSGQRVVTSTDGSAGTRAYTSDFASFVQLHTKSEHSDLGIGAEGEDLYVYTDYTANALRVKRCDTGGVVRDICPMYPRSGSGYAAHVSCRAFDRPGVAVISTYADFHSHDQRNTPDHTIEAPYRKVFLAELNPGGRVLNLAHTRVQGAGYGGYAGEHQATPSRDLTKVVFASNWGSGNGPIDAYVIDVPAF